MAKKNEQIMIREFISQKDIDDLLESAFVEHTEAADELELELSDLAETTTFDTDAGGVDQGLISNDDIGALFKNSGASSSAKDATSHDTTGSIVSQSDIDALLRGGPDATAPTTSAQVPLEAADIGGMVSQSDIDALLSGELGAIAPSPSRKDEMAANIDEMISQSDIDALLKGEMAAKSDDNEFEAAGGDGAISQADLDSLLSGDQRGADEDTGVSSLISQSDIDALLGGGAKEAPEIEDSFVPQERNEDGEVVSQSDIDALLKAAMASEEDAGTRDDDDTHEGIVSQSDIDSLLSESLGEKPLEEKEPATEPVILAEDSEIPMDAIPASSAPSRPWYFRKVYQISALAAVVLVISSSVFLMTPRSRLTVPQPVVLTFPIPKPASQAVTAKMQGNTNITMAGFLVLAPSDNSDITCLVADLVLDFSDTTTVRMIKENEGIIRNIIYGVINDALFSRDKSAVDKSNLALAVRAALGNVVSREMIRSVSIEKFEMI